MLPPQKASFLGKIFNFLVPPRCLTCSEILADHMGLCPACWGRTRFIADPLCHICGRPFDFHTDEIMMCLDCIEKRPIYHQARAPLVYEGPGRELILRFKHSDATYMSPVFARWMIQAGQGFLPQCHGLIPVPMHWSRLIYRGYNQAALLSKDIARLTGVPHYPLALKRCRKTEAQGQKNQEERHRNVRRAFVVPKKYKALIKGQTLCLIDDVLASGATLKECAKTLKKAGARKIYVLTLARV